MVTYRTIANILMWIFGAFTVSLLLNETPFIGYAFYLLYTFCAYQRLKNNIGAAKMCLIVTITLTFSELIQPEIQAFDFWVVLISAIFDYHILKSIKEKTF